MKATLVGLKSFKKEKAYYFNLQKSITSKFA